MMRTKYAILASALLYALVPVAIVLVGAERGALFGLAVNLNLFLIGVIAVALRPELRQVLRESLRPGGVLLLSLVNALALGGSLALGYLALSGEPIAAAVIIDIWPVFALFLIPAISGGTVRFPDPFQLVVVVVSLLGFLSMALDGDAPQWLGMGLSSNALLALASAGLMAISVAAKFLAVRRLARNGVGSTGVQAVLQVFYLLPALAFVPFVDWHGAAGEVDASLLVYPAATALLIFASSALYNAFLESTKEATEQIIWYFSPVVAALIFILLGLDEVDRFKVIGMIMIVTCNIVLSFPAEKGIAYRYSVIFLVFAGFVCVYFPGLAHDHYYEIVSLSSVFFVVLATLTLEGGRGRIDRELAMFREAWGRLDDAMGQGGPDRAILERFWATESVRDKSAARRELQRLEASLAARPNDATAFIASYEAYLASRFHPAGFAEFMALTAMGLVTVVVAIVFRPGDTASDIVGTAVAFSVVFLYLANFDLLRDRRLGFFVAPPSGAALKRPFSRYFYEEATTDARYWSGGIVVVILAALIALFARVV